MICWANSHSIQVQDTQWYWKLIEITFHSNEYLIKFSTFLQYIFNFLAYSRMKTWKLQNKTQCLNYIRFARLLIERNTLDSKLDWKSLQSTGTGTKFGAYPCPSPTIFQYEMNIYWPIMKNKLTNKEHSLHST